MLDFQTTGLELSNIIITGYLDDVTCYHGVIGKLSRFPGSPSIWVSHNLEVPTTHRGKGYSTEYNSYMLSIAFLELMASAVVCSVKQDNVLQQRRLRKLGWDRISKALWMTKEVPE